MYTLKFVYKPCSNIRPPNRSLKFLKAPGLIHGALQYFKLINVVPLQPFSPPIIMTLENRTQGNLTRSQSISTPVQILVSIQLILFILGHANLLVMFLLLKKRKLRTITNMFTFNLCFADYLFCLELPFLSILSLAPTWFIAPISCKLFFTLEAAAKFACVFFITVLSVDRYLAICHPQWCKGNRSTSRAAILCVLIWCIVLLLVSPIAFFSNVLQLGPLRGSMCTVFWPDEYAGGRYILMTFTMGFAIPFLVVLSCYCCVLKELVLASRRVKRLKGLKCTGGSATSRYKKVTKMVLAIVSFFVICWAPFWVQNIFTTFYRMSKSKNHQWKFFFNLVHILPFTNCALNAFLYAFLTEDFRNALKSFFIRSTIHSQCESPIMRQHFLSLPKHDSIMINSSSETVCLLNPKWQEHPTTSTKPRLSASRSAMSVDARRYSYNSIQVHRSDSWNPQETHV